MIGFSSSKLGHCKTIDKQRIVIEMETADREILKTSESLDTIKYISRYLKRSYQIALDAKRRLIFHILRYIIYNL